jgi:hypothetical protein
MTTMIFFPFNTVFSPDVQARFLALVIYHKSQIHPRNFGPRIKLMGFQAFLQVWLRQGQTPRSPVPERALRAIATVGNAEEKYIELQRR